MRLARIKGFYAAGIVAASHCLCGHVVWAQTNIQPASLPIGVNEEVPLPPSPVDLFRQLMAKDPDGQEQVLADRTPENRKEILAKVREYKALKPDQCELKLRATELRWHLRRLMGTPPVKRPALMAMVPEQERKLVEIRLQQWDRLPAAAKRELHTNESAIIYFTMPEEQKSQYLASISPARSNMLQEGITQLQAMPEEQRQRILARFNQFFDFQPQEKQKVLSAFSEPERQQIKKTLSKFAELPPVERAVCIRSFEKFAGMSIDERQQFLKNAERWKLMAPAERQQWKELVENLSALPPSPPGATFEFHNSR